MGKDPEDGACSPGASPEPWIHGPTRKDAGFSLVKGLVPATTFSSYKHQSDDVWEKVPHFALALHLGVMAHLSPWVLMRMLARCLHAWHSVRDEGQDSMFH